MDDEDNMDDETFLEALARKRARQLEESTGPERPTGLFTANPRVVILEDDNGW